MKSFTAIIVFSVLLNLFAGMVQSSSGICLPKRPTISVQNPVYFVQAKTPAWVSSLQSSINNKKQDMIKKRPDWRRWVEPALVTICAGTTVYVMYSARGRR